MPDRREAILIASTNASRPSKKRILTVCVKLFLEQGYKKTTVAQIVQQASVSNSIFQNIFRAKDGVLTELAQFMLSNQFAMARSTAGTAAADLCLRRGDGHSDDADGAERKSARDLY